MIRLAEGGDHAQLKALWTAVFGDTPEAVDAYFSLRHRDEDMLVWAENGRIDGMLSMLPLELILNKKEYPARYVYAVATAPTQRNRGIAGLLLGRAGELIAERGEAAAVLVPASASLFDYYAKRGFRTAFSLNVADFDARALPPCPDGQLADCSSGEYARIRDRAFAGSGLYARWDERAVGYALQALGDGGAARLILNGGEGAVCWTRTGCGVLVRELALVGIDVPFALALLHRKLGALSYRARLPAGAIPKADIAPFGMIRWFAPEPAVDGPGYLSLALD
ncbi:MAG: GNAT family N-acetyltransferase [Clostridiales bacterium]|nr:GNAT family N-acetyltransferase [Clostridiales bacterium]